MSGSFTTFPRPASLARRPGAGNSRTPISPPPGDCPALTIRSAKRCTGASRIPCRTRACSAMAAIPDGTSRTSPSDLYSNSTVALDPETGKLKWYYQHLPADDWDMDYTHERTLVREKFNPDPKYVKWFNPDIPRGEEHDVAVMVGEGGGVFEIDRGTGQFLWATPFPYDDPLFLISNIDGKTGKVTINYDLVNKKPGEEHIICSTTPKLLAHGLRSRYQFAVRALHRQLSRHDVGGRRTKDSSARLASPCRVRAPIRTRSPRSARSISSTGEIQRFNVGTLAFRWRGSGHRGRPAFSGRSESALPRLRRRHRPEALGIDPGRIHFGEHHHVCGERQTIRRRDDRQWAVGWRAAGRNAGAASAARDQRHLLRSRCRKLPLGHGQSRARGKISSGDQSRRCHASCDTDRACRSRMASDFSQVFTVCSVR